MLCWIVFVYVINRIHFTIVMNRDGEFARINLEKKKFNRREGSKIVGTRRMGKEKEGWKCKRTQETYPGGRGLLWRRCIGKGR